MALDVVERFRAVILEALGLGYQGAPQVDRLALYRAEVLAASADGATVDVRPESARIPATQAVPLCAPFPGATVQCAPGSVVLIGWEAGDPSRIYAVPSWESGSSVTIKLAASTKITVDGGALVDIPSTSVTCGPVGSIPVLVQGTTDGVFGVPVSQLPTCTGALKAG